MLKIRSQTGASMIEVLISLLIVAIGLLGQMTLQMTGVASNQSSYYRSQASILANEFVDKMRLNRDGVTNNIYDDISINTSSTYTQPACYTNGCGFADQVLVDIYDVQETIKNSIPSGTVTVIRDPSITEQAVFQITVSWQLEDRAGLTNGNNVNRFVMDFGI